MFSKEELEEKYSQTREELQNGHYEKSIEDFRSLIQDFKEIGLDAWAVKAYNGLGAAYARSDNEEMAVRSYFDGINYAREHRVHEWSSVLYQNVGAKFFILADYQMAIKYGELALNEIRYSKKAIDNIFGMSELGSILNLTESFIRDEQFAKAKQFLAEAKKLIEAKGTNYNEGTLAYLICDTELAWYQGDYVYAREQIKQIMEQIRTIPFDAYEVYSITAGLIPVLQEMKDYEAWGELTQYLNDKSHQAASIPFLKRANRYRRAYYRETGQREKYLEACTERYECSVLLRELDRAERIQALNLKVDLRATAQNIRNVQLKSLLDPLTNLQNRRALRNRMYVLEGNRDEKNYGALGIVDIDCFKELNDAYGHLLGDEALKAVARKLEDIIDGVGGVYRYGGDEFVFILEHIKLDLVEKVCEDLVHGIENLAIPNKNSNVRDILTISIGCFVNKGAMPMSGEEIIDQADMALYEAKKTGKARYSICNGDCLTEDNY